MLRFGSALFLAATFCLPQAYAQDQKTVAVMPLLPQRVPKEITSILDELVTTEVFNRSEMKVIGASDINAMLGLEKMKSALGCDDVSCAAEIGGALGVDLMLSGTVGRLGGELIITLKLIDTSKTELKNRVSLRIPAQESAYARGIADAVGQLLGLAPEAPAPEAPKAKRDASEAIAETPAPPAATAAPLPEPEAVPEMAPEPPPATRAEDASASHLTFGAQFWVVTYFNKFEPRFDAEDGILQADQQADNVSTGMGAKIYPGFHFSSGLIAEVAVGWVLRSYDGQDPSFGTIEHVVVMPGARYEILDGPLKPWVGAHLGLSILLTDFNAARDDKQYPGFGFDLGAGVSYALGNHFELGLGVWYNFAQQDTGDDAYGRSTPKDPANASFNPEDSNPPDPGSFLAFGVELRGNL